MAQTATATRSASSSWWRPWWELMRLDKFPAGSYLTFWPCAWGYILASRNDKPDLPYLIYILVVFFIGCTLMHSAMCTINDIFDRDFDRQVERTKDRPIASGRVSVQGAWVFFVVQVAIFIAMSSRVTRESFICGSFGIFPLQALYPLAKRFTYWPQAWLGVAINWGLPTAWLLSAPGDYKSSAMWTLTFGAWCWTIIYDTIYACQDAKDDKKAGVKSTALLFSDKIREILSLFGFGFVSALIYAGVELRLGVLYYLISVGGCAAHLFWQLSTLDPDDGDDCWTKFSSNGNLGYIILGGILADMYI